MDKTCGNCGMFASEPFKQRSGACMGSFDRDTCTYHSTSIHRDESNCPWCSGWIPKQEPIEQSYQQLTQVAQDMLRFIKNIEREYPQLLDPNRKPGGQIVYPMLSDEYVNQLEELGVEL